MSALLVAALLLVAAFAATSSASAATIYACQKKKGGTIHIVAKKAKCKKGETKISWSSTGPGGKNGANGANGSNGSNGKDGANGAVAGYGAVQSSSLDLTGKNTPVQVPGLTKALPAGSFVASANIEIDALSKGAGAAGVLCELVDTPSTGPKTEQFGRWLSALNVPFFTLDLADGEIPFNMPISTGSKTSTISLQCEETLESGSEVEITAADGAIVVVQTSQNS